MTKKKRVKTPRNWIAIHAHLRTGAGRHTDQKKAANKKACRKKVTRDG